MVCLVLEFVDLLECFEFLEVLELVDVCLVLESLEVLQCLKFFELRDGEC